MSRRLGPVKVRQHTLGFKLKAVKLGQFMLSRWRKEARASTAVLNGSDPSLKGRTTRPQRRDVVCERRGHAVHVCTSARDTAKPRLLSLFPLPQPPEGEPYKNFCEKGGRFGPHNLNHEVHLPGVEKPGNLIYMTYFNAGLRIFNIKDPISPKESGWFIPPPPLKRYGPQPPNDLVQQSEDVLVDTRGYVYLDDKHWGLFILRYTGPDQPAPTAK